MYDITKLYLNTRLQKGIFPKAKRKRYSYTGGLHRCFSVQVPTPHRWFIFVASVVKMKVFCRSGMCHIASPRSSQLCLVRNGCSSSFCRHEAATWMLAESEALDPGLQTVHFKLNCPYKNCEVVCVILRLHYVHVHQLLIINSIFQSKVAWIIVCCSKIM